MPDRDIRTRYPGVYARHKVGCRTESGGRCSCSPSYFASVYDRDRKRYVKTRRQQSIAAARSARDDLIRALQTGQLPESGGIRLAEARERFVKSAREGRALNKRGLRYKPRAIDNVEEVLRVHIEPTLGTKRLSTISRGDVQKIVDELTPTMSGSRIRSIVNGLRSLYRWAQDRDLAMHDPAALVRLPAMNATAVLDAAGVPPKIASVLMGHATPERQAGAAQITLARYTHALPEDILKARDTFTAYLTAHQAERAAR